MEPRSVVRYGSELPGMAEGGGMRAAVAMAGRWRQDSGRASDDPLLRAIQGQMAWVRAPESLRARIGAMLAVERAHPSAGEPEGPSPR